MKNFVLLICLFSFIYSEIGAQTTCQSNLQMVCDQKRRKETDIKRDSAAIAEMKIQLERMESNMRKSQQVLCALDQEEKLMVACVTEEQRVQSIETAESVLERQYQESKSALKRLKQTKNTVQKCPPGVNCQ